MNLILMNPEDLEDLVQASIEKGLNKFYSQKLVQESEPSNLSIKETAIYLSVTETTIRNYIQRGLIKADKIGGRIFISRDKLLESLKEVKSFKYQRDE